MGRLGGRRAVASCAVLLALGLAGCSHDAPQPAEDGGVDAAARFTGRGSDLSVEVTLTPQRDGFHIYGTDLDPQETQGFGVPTSVAISGGLEPRGPLTASESSQVLSIEALHVRLPVYPDGPVTFTLPVRRIADAAATVDVSYGACSSSVCLRPIRHRKVTVEG